jgi:hypothetical protein
MSDSQRLIAETCDEIKALLLEKNKKYGDSALSPLRVFSRADAVEQIRVRIDDKLSRIRATGESASDEDTARDLLGYLVLLLVAKKMVAAEVRDLVVVLDSGLRCPVRFDGGTP